MAGIARLDKVRSVYNGHIESVLSADNALELENGMVGVAGGLVERELRAFEAPTDETARLHLIYNSEINYDEYTRKSNALENFKQEGGVPSRAYSLEKGDIFSVSADMVSSIGALPVKNNFLVAETGSLKLKEVATLDPLKTYGFVGKVAGNEKLGTITNVGQAGVISRINDLVVVDVIQN